MTSLARAAVALAFAGTLLGGCHKKPADDGRNEEQRKKSAETDAAAKKGALKEKDDPAADLKHQKQNLARLQMNAKQDREAGNRVGAWTAERDIKKVEKLIAKDRALLGDDGQNDEARK